MDRIVILRKRLAKLSPAHDYPVGLLHPYWARKPFNVVGEIISNLTDKGGMVADPFMGSGTVIFSSLSLGRTVFGSDLNPLSVFLVSTVLGLRKSSIDYKYETEKFLKELSDLILDWYRIGDLGSYMERERFYVKGRFEDGRFSLSRCEVVVKQLKDGRWTGRKVLHNGVDSLTYDIDKEFIAYPLDFTKIGLMYNSRIAVPRGATLDQFYTRENIAAINAAIHLSNKKGLTCDVRNLRRLLLSASLPLLRLSDKKASSQWPYWRPKRMLTSRNPIAVLKSRVDCMINLIDWLEANLPEIECSSGRTMQFAGRTKFTCTIMNRSCQDLASISKQHRKYDLVLSDPPYYDHIPYLEYSALWTGILGFSVTKKSLRHEIVRSDSPEREKDSADYLRRLRKGYDNCCKLLKDGGFLVWFYQDTNLKHWKEIWMAAHSNHMSILDVIPFPKQRRSMKTVTTPEKTLDGDLLCVFQKRRKSSISQNANDCEALLKRIRSKFRKSRKNLTYFDKYALVVRDALISGSVDVLSKKYDKVTAVIKALEL